MTGVIRRSGGKAMVPTLVYSKGEETDAPVGGCGGGATTYCISKGSVGRE